MVKLITYTFCICKCNKGNRNSTRRNCTKLMPDEKVQVINIRKLVIYIQFVHTDDAHNTCYCTFMFSACSVVRTALRSPTNMYEPLCTCITNTLCTIHIITSEYHLYNIAALLYNMYLLSMIYYISVYTYLLSSCKLRI